MEKKEKRVKRIQNKLLHKYRLVILNEQTFEERFSFKLNRLNVFVTSILFAGFLIGTTTLIIAFTPLREYISGYSSTALKRQVAQMVYQTDSLNRVIAMNEQYLNSIKSVLTGEIKAVEFNKDSILAAAQSDPIVLGKTSEMDSILRMRVAQEDKYNPLIPSSDVQYSFFAPVKGTISDPYDSEKKHYAVDRSEERRVG